jgi:hypothetical protein
MAERCAMIGAPELTKAVVGDIERGRKEYRYARGRQVTVEELTIFAEALSVPVMWLITPLDAGDSLTITPDRAKLSYQALPWIDGTAELPPADWLTVPAEEDIKSWQAARTELMLVRGWLLQIRTVWDLLNSDGDNAAAIRAAAETAKTYGDLLRASGMIPPPAPPAVVETIARGGSNGSQ